MEWKDIAGMVKTAAPMVGTAIGGPVGTAIGGAVSSLISAFGLAGDATADDVHAAITNDPDAALKLKVAENDFALKVKQLENDDLKLTLADVQSARSRQVEHEKATGSSDVNLYVLAWVVVAGFFIVMVLNMLTPMSDNPALNLLIGALIGGFTMVLSYFFGSSKSSAEKSKTIAAMKKG